MSRSQRKLGAEKRSEKALENIETLNKFVRILVKLRNRKLVVIVTVFIGWIHCALRLFLSTQGKDSAASQIFRKPHVARILYRAESHSHSKAECVLGCCQEIPETKDFPAQDHPKDLGLGMCQTSIICNLSFPS